MSPDALRGLLTFASLGGVALGFGARQRWREQRPRGWLQVPGIIVTSRTERQYLGRGRYQYVAEVEYEYCHHGQTLRSHRIRMSNFCSGTKPEAEMIASRYPVGGSVTVLVDPQRSDSAVLEYGPTLLSSICIGLGLSLAALALLPLFLR